MVFYRYQNTKTLEQYSYEYVDMTCLCHMTIDYIYNYLDGVIDSNKLIEYMSRFTCELSYRQNIYSDEDINNILNKIIQIIKKYYNHSISFDNLSTIQKLAKNEVRLLMKNYPLKGIFVVPEYNDRFDSGTKFSETELRSNVITSLGVSEAKYLAIYEGEVICEDMEFGGTLIRPSKLIKVVDLYKECIDERICSDEYIFYRDLLDNNKFEKVIAELKKSLTSKYSSMDYIAHKIDIHTRELIIRKILLLTNSTYKELEYRNFNGVHYILIKKDNARIKFCISDKEVSKENVLNGDTIIYDGEVYLTNKNTNAVKKSTFTLNLTV